MCCTCIPLSPTMHFYRRHAEAMGLPTLPGTTRVLLVFPSPLRSHTLSSLAYLMLSFSFTFFTNKKLPSHHPHQRCLLLVLTFVHNKYLLLNNTGTHSACRMSVLQRNFVLFLTPTLCTSFLFFSNTCFHLTTLSPLCCLVHINFPCCASYKLQLFLLSNTTHHSPCCLIFISTTLHTII